MSAPEVFYAVTKSTSVYLARIGGTAEGAEVPSFTKIAGPESKKIPVGTVIANGSMLAICKELRLFEPEGGDDIVSKPEREIANVSLQYHRGHTSPIVALFIDKAEALACVKAPDLQLCDLRWKNSTVAVLKSIGRDHKCCSISIAGEKWWLMPYKDWHGSANGQK